MRTESMLVAQRSHLRWPGPLTSLALARWRWVAWRACSGARRYAYLENARRATGEREEREQARGVQKATPPPPTLKELGEVPRGDLIVKMPLSLPRRALTPRTLRLSHPRWLSMPPIALVTSVHGDAPLGAFGSLWAFSLLPAVMRRLAIAHADAARAQEDTEATAGETSMPPALAAMDAATDATVDTPHTASETPAVTAATAATEITTAVAIGSRASLVAPTEELLDVSAAEEGATAMDDLTPTPAGAVGGRLSLARLVELQAEVRAASSHARARASSPSTPRHRVTTLTASAVSRLGALSVRVIAQAFADDVVIDLGTMSAWSEEAARTYFESGGIELPPPVATAPVAAVPVAAVLAATAAPAAANTAAPAAVASPTTPPHASTAPPPALRAFASRARAHARGEARRVRACEMLTAVCVRVGGTTPRAPSASAMSVMRFLSAAIPQLEWSTFHMVQGLQHALLPDEETAVEDALLVIVETERDDAGGGGPATGQLIFDPKVGKLVPVRPKTAHFTAPMGPSKLRDETVDEEIALGRESDVARKRAELEYLHGGCSYARELMEGQGADALYRCHMRGGVLIAIDQAGPVLGQLAQPLTASQKQRAAAAAAACATSVAPVVAPVVPMPAADSGEVPPTPPLALGQWPQLLPFAVGLAPPAPPDKPEVLSWRRLRGTSREVRDCASGYAAVGLPPGSAVAVLTERRCKLRAALGSAQPRIFSAERIRERIEGVARTREARRVEADCERKLGELKAALERCGEAFPAPIRPNGPFMDFHGKVRGQCPRCNTCPGYDLPRTPHEQSLLILCVHCGCDAAAHEMMRTEAERRAEQQDDILRPK